MWTFLQELLHVEESRIQGSAAKFQSRCRKIIGQHMTAPLLQRLRRDTMPMLSHHPCVGDNMILSTHPLLPHDINHEEETSLGKLHGECPEEPVLFLTSEVVYGKT